MRRLTLIPAGLCLSLAIVFALALPLHAQQSSSNSSDKTPAAQNSNQDQSQSNSSKPPTDSNAFPEDVSRKAERDKAQQAKKPDTPDAAEPSDTDAAQSPKPPDSSENPFPEETSRKAAADAKASGSDNSGSGVSSSGDYDDRATGGRSAVVPNVSMSHIHDKDPSKEDLQVGTYYLQAHDYAGAYARFKEASALHPENTDAIFGLAEAARNLKKNDEAIQNYELFLDIVDSGSKARDARKALASLAKPH